MVALEQVCELARQAGKSAHEAGRLRTSNPHNRPAALPSATGEPVANWRARSDAWLSGWDEASAAKGRKPRTGRASSQGPTVDPATASGMPSVAVQPIDSPRRWYVRDNSGIRRLTVFLMTEEEAQRLFPGAEPGPNASAAGHEDERT